MSEQKKRRPNSSFRLSRSSVQSPKTSMSKSAPNVSSVKTGADVACETGRPRTTPTALSKTVRSQPNNDHVWKIVEEEGRTARNLVTWNVPIEDETLAKAKCKPYNVAASPTHKVSQRSDSSCHRSQSDSRPASSLSSPATQRKMVSSDKSSMASKVPGKKDLRARYWAFLFENLQRAVDEIYQTCETDESVVECKEVIMMLNQYTKDFQSLIDRLHVLRAYDNADDTNKPTSLAWELRKSSPGKSLSSHHVMKETPSTSVSRSLTFTCGVQPPALALRETTAGDSWADRVKGVRHVLPISSSQTNDASVPDELPGAVPPALPSACCLEDDGWETVQRAGKLRPARNTTAACAKTSNAVGVRTTSGEDNPHKTESDGSNLLAPAVEQKLSAAERPSSVSAVQLSAAEPAGSVPSCSSTDVFQDILLHSKSLSDETLTGDTSAITLPSTESVIEHKKRPPRHCVSALNEDDADGEYDDDDDDDEEDDDDDFENSLCNAMDEEDTLAHELEQEQEAALESAIEQEETWLQELAREQSLEIQVDTEPDTEHEEFSAAGSCSCSGRFDSPLQQSMDWDSFVQQFEDEAESRRDVPWGDLVEEAESRTPGRVVHVHEKLSSPSRKRSVTDSKKHQEEKQAKAHELREKLLAEKAERLRLLAKKVEEVQLWKNDLLQQRRLTMAHRLERAEQKRQIQLQLRVRKAHEEETKGNEIAFINSLEAQNKRHEIMSKHQESEARLLDMQEERQRKHEEKAAKEAAVEERRRALETERQTRFQEIAERRRQRASEFELRQQEKEKERAEVARAKEREREERLAALNKQQQAHIEELQKKIQLKQDETDRRHKEKLEAIQEKAFKMSILRHSTEDHNDAPKLVPYEKKKICVVCNVMIPSEVYLLSHLRGKKHQQAISDSNTNTGRELTRQEIENFNLKHIADAPLDRPDPQSVCDRERLKVLRKRCKKLRQRLSQRGLEYDNCLSAKQQPSVESEHKAKLVKLSKDLLKYIRSPSNNGPWPQNMVTSLDRTLGEISRILERKVAADQVALRCCSGLVSLCSVLGVVGQSQSDILAIAPTKSLLHICTALRHACLGCYDNCLYLLLSGKICILVDVLSHHLAMMIPDSCGNSAGASVFKLPYCPMASSLMDLLAAVLSTLATAGPERKHSLVMSSNADVLSCQTTDIVSYTVSLGILDRLSQYLSSVRGPVDNDCLATVEFLQHSLDLITAIVRLTARRSGDVFFDKKKADDSTQLIVTLKATQLVGIVSLLYGMLLHIDAPARCESAPPVLSAHTLLVVKSAFNLLNNVASLNLQLLQSALGEEGTSLEFRHIGSYLLWYCHHHSEELLLHELILCIGYFCVLNHDNQVIIQSGQPPTVLQQLCSLPFPYFSDTQLMNVLFPTLVSCCFQLERNREILEQELSCALLANFIEEKILERQPLSSKKLKLTSEKDVDLRMTLSARFPIESWPAAQSYFSTSS